MVSVIAVCAVAQLIVISGQFTSALIHRTQCEKLFLCGADSLASKFVNLNI